MARLAILGVLIATLLAGCGQVIVFGHVVGDHRASEPKSESVPADAPAPQSATPATSASASAGDSSATAQPPLAPKSSSNPSVTHVVKAVNVTVTPEAAAKVAGDASRFTADALLEAIKAELKSRKLLDEQDPQAAGTAEIVVDGLATRSTTNAIVFGYKMLAGTLEGDIRVIGPDRRESTGSRIVAESKLTLAASGNDKDPLGPLYRRFAVLAGDRLAGVTSKPQDSTGIPRF